MLLLREQDLPKRDRARRALPVLLGFAIAACSSGGGGGFIPPPVFVPTPIPPALAASTPPNMPTQTAAQFRTTEYNQNWALEDVKAADAYARGYTGKGVTIGVVDYHFEFSSPEIHYDPASVGINAADFALGVAENPASADYETAPHGYAVAVAAAGVKNGSGTHGLAFDATILAVDIFSGIDETQLTSGDFLDHVTHPFDYLTSHGVRIINTSWGSNGSDSGIVEIGSPTSDKGPVVLEQPNDVTERYRIQRRSDAVADGALLVASAGNDGGTDPQQSNLEIVTDLQTRNLLNGPGALIIVGAVDSSNQIASYSDKAGAEKDFYMVAPGDRVVGPWTGPGLFFLSGTSFSAPMVAGAAAILLQRWPTLTTLQVRDILFASATDLGAPGVDDIYGHGLLNVDAALQPNGVTTMAVENGNGPAVSATGIVFSAPFGNAVAFRGAISSLMMLDSFGRDFSVDVSPSALTRSNVSSVADVMEARLNWRGVSVSLGDETHLAVHLRSDPTPPSGENLDQPQTPPAMFELSGSAMRVAWAVGTGIDLEDALNGDNPHPGAELTGAFRPQFLSPGAYSLLRFSVTETARISFGISDASLATPDDPLSGVTEEYPRPQAAALRLDEDFAPATFSVEVGDTMEHGAILGAVSSGALKLADRSSTEWASVDGSTEIAQNWRLEAAVTLSATQSTPATSSVIRSVHGLWASSFSIGVEKDNFLGKDDSISFTAYQPLRIESGHFVITQASGRSADGTILFDQVSVPMAPGGREIALESDYAKPIGNWNLEMSFDYRFDANHAAGAKEATGVLWLSRRF